MTILTKGSQPDIYDVPSMENWFEAQGFDRIDMGNLYTLLGAIFAGDHEFDLSEIEYATLLDEYDELRYRTDELESDNEHKDLLIEKLQAKVASLESRLAR